MSKFHWFLIGMVVSGVWAVIAVIVVGMIIPSSGESAVSPVPSPTMTVQVPTTSSSPTRVPPTTAVRPTVIPVSNLSIESLNQDLEIIDYWIDSFGQDVVGCAESGRLPNRQEYGDLFITFGEISGSVGHDLSDGVLDEWKASDIRYVLDSFTEVITDINVRCGLTW